MTEEEPVDLLIKALMKAQEDIKENQPSEAKLSDNTKPKIKKGKKRDAIFRLVHRELLSRPLCRRLQPYPNPEFERQWKVSKAALNAKMTDRLEFLALPRQNICESCNSNTNLPKSNLRNKVVKISSRLEFLATPQLITEQTNKKIDKKCFKTKQEWLNHLARLKTLSSSRKTLPSTPEPIRKKKPLSDLIPYIEILAIPSYRPPNTNEKTYEETYTINPAALKYQISVRIDELSKPRLLNKTTKLNKN